MNSFLKLIRYKNLLIIAVAQYIMRFCIIKPFLQLNGFHLQLDDFHFFLLVLTTMLIASAGYVINDYFDIRTDRINKPDRVIIDSAISRRQAIALQTALSLSGIAIAIYLSWHVGVLPLALLFVLCSGVLWFYSTTYKRQLLIGNFVVSVMTGGVPLLVALYEIPLLNKAYGDIMIQNHVNFNYRFLWIVGFSFFAFLTNFIREIIKDAEDFEGDSAYGMNTVPIYFGIGVTKSILAVLISVSIILLKLIMRFIVLSGEKIDLITSGYFIFLLIVPFSILLYMVITASSKKDYHNASVLIKFIMLAGILYSCVVRYIVIYQIT